jgi:hypothetical protein
LQGMAMGERAHHVQPPDSRIHRWIEPELTQNQKLSSW